MTKFKTKIKNKWKSFWKAERERSRAITDKIGKKTIIVLIFCVMLGTGISKTIFGVLPDYPFGLDTWIGVIYAIMLGCLFFYKFVYQMITEGFGNEKEKEETTFKYKGVKLE